MKKKTTPYAVNPSIPLRHSGQDLRHRAQEKLSKRKNKVAKRFA